MRRRLIIAFALLFGLFSIGIGASLYFHWQSSRQLLSLITGHQIEELRRVLSYRLHQSQRDLQASDTIFAAQLDEIIANVEELDRAVDSCEDCHHDEIRRQQLHRIATLVGQYKDQYSTIITALLNPEMRERLLLDANATAAEIDIQVDRMLEPATATLALRSQQALAQVDRSWQILAITLVSTFFLAVLTTAILVRGITDPIQTLVAATDKILEGALGYQIDHRESHEFGQLMNSFNKMSTTLASNRQRLDGQVERFRLLNQAVFSLYATPDTESLRDRLVHAMEGLTDAEYYGTVLKATAANIFVIAVRRRGEKRVALHHAISGSRLTRIYEAAAGAPMVGGADGATSWPFDRSEGDPPLHNFVLTWIVFNGELCGGLAVLDKPSGDFVGEDLQIFQALASGVAEAVENIRLYQELQSQA